MWLLFFLFIAISTTNAGTAPNTCPPGHHWVKEHHRRAYYRAEGTLVSAADVAAHCRKNPSGFHAWSGLLKEGRPPNWRHPNEQSKNWSVEETERMLEALGETPAMLKEQGVDGFYRMAKANAPGNPASLRGTSVAVYDEAFEKEHVLAHVLAHELAHRLFEGLSEDERKSFLRAGKWKDVGGGRFSTQRVETTFLRKVGMISPEEDFADGVSACFHQPKKLRETSPALYDWMEKHVKLKTKEIK